jgi:ribosomal protein L35
MKSHLLEKKSPKRKRRFRKASELHGTDVREVKRLLGGLVRRRS